MSVDNSPPQAQVNGFLVLRYLATGNSTQRTTTSYLRLANQASRTTSIVTNNQRAELTLFDSFCIPLYAHFLVRDTVLSSGARYSNFN